MTMPVFTMSEAPKNRESVYDGWLKIALYLANCKGKLVDSGVKASDGSYRHNPPRFNYSIFPGG